MLNAGQVCLAAKRVYVPRKIYDALCDELARLANGAVVDDGSRQGTDIGPIQNRQQYDRVLEFVEAAHADGKVIAGGAALDRPGYFIAPTIVRDIGDDSRLVREEQFGPVLPLLVYDDLDDAIARANDSPYGLGGTIWTGDSERGLAVALSHRQVGRSGSTNISISRSTCRFEARSNQDWSRERPGGARRVHSGEDHQRRAVRDCYSARRPRLRDKLYSQWTFARLNRVIDMSKVRPMAKRLGHSEL